MNNKSNFKHIKDGDKLSETQYYTVEDVSRSGIMVVNDRGMRFTISKDIVEEGIYSANQFSEEKKITKTEMAELFSHIGDTVFTVNFNKQIKDLSGVDYSRCYQCLTCTLSCPVISIMDYSPNQIIRMIQLGARSKVLQSNTIWRCASCETCAGRCPQGIDIRRLMDTL